MHRPTDGRLLSNLVAHEKDYAKTLKALLSPSHALSAYAAACAPPLSSALLEVSAALAGADAALARYADAVDECREYLGRIKDLEEDLGVVVRDREILITRLIKASRSKTAQRESVHHLSSGSTHSLSSGMSSPSPSSSSRRHSIHVPASSKLGAAQAELQACEATLAQKERALQLGRVEALRSGLGLRCRALMECGWVWAQVEDYGRGVRDDVRGASKSLPRPPSETYYIPPAHAISDSHPFPAQPRVLPRRITEETIRNDDDGGSSAEELETHVRAVDNPRYATPEQKAGLLGRRGSNASSSGGRLFGSLKGLFGGETRTKRNVRDVERDMRAAEAGARERASDVGGDAKRKLKKARSPRSASVPPAGLFAGTEIEKRHLAAAVPRSARKPSVSVDRRASIEVPRTPRKVPARPAVSPLRSALRNPSRTSSPMPRPDTSSDSGDDVFFEAEEGDVHVHEAPPRRRKSVRVSLNPTFSWEDSSEEDAEYTRARSLLSQQQTIT